MRTILDAWAHAESFGERYLRALRAYQEVFFADEEVRIRPVLREALEKAQALAERLPWVDLLEELSQGVRFYEELDFSELVLAPSYWLTPLVILVQLGQTQKLLLFGARPPDASLVPGEVVPDTLLRGLKALSDPTRLRILRYLSSESLTPTQLAHRLRLRPPTVIHHLNALRLAGLIHVNLGAGKERRYAARTDTVGSTLASLREFLEQDDPDGVA